MRQKVMAHLDCVVPNTLIHRLVVQEDRAVVLALQQFLPTMETHSALIEEHLVRRLRE
jgi:hypothetical protein